MPVPQQVMIIQNIQRHTGKTPALTGKQPLAGDYLRVLIGKCVHGAMVP
jgi:hypothetical protein